MRRILTLVLTIALNVCCASRVAFASPQGEYRAFTFTDPLGCPGLTTEFGGIPDCYDSVQNWARYIWSPTLKQYVPAPDAILTVAKLPLATDPSTKSAILAVADSLNPCVAGNVLTGGGSFVCPVFNDGTSWKILGLAGGGSSGVSVVSAGTGINITGTSSSPVVNLTVPVSTTNGGTGVSAPTAHNLMIAEGASPFTLISCANNQFLAGTAGDPACRLLANSDLPTSGVTAGTYTLSTVTVNAQGIVTAASNGSVGGNTVTMTNNTSTGTVNNKIATYDIGQSGPKAVLANTSQLSGIIGIVHSGGGITGAAVISVAGTESCVFDGPTTINDYVIASATVAGDCHDTGSTSPPIGSGGQQVTYLGTVNSTNAAGGTYAMALSIVPNTGGLLGNVAVCDNATLTSNVNKLLRYQNYSGIEDICNDQSTLAIPGNYTWSGSQLISGTGANLTVAGNHVILGAGPPTVSACGTTPTQPGSSDHDQAFSFTTGTGGTTCTVTFAHATAGTGGSTPWTGWCVDVTAVPPAILDPSYTSTGGNNVSGFTVTVGASHTVRCLGFAHT